MSGNKKRIIFLNKPNHPIKIDCSIEKRSGHTRGGRPYSVVSQTTREWFAEIQTNKVQISRSSVVLDGLDGIFTLTDETPLTFATLVPRGS